MSERPVGRESERPQCREPGPSGLMRSSTTGDTMSERPRCSEPGPSGRWSGMVGPSGRWSGMVGPSGPLRSSKSGQR
jgi:hypothetical protein